MKREYEIGLIINPETADEEAEKIKTSITDILEKGKGTIENIDDWGRKALAYPIEKHKEGIYVFIKTMSPGDVIAAVERRLKLNEKVMRFIVIRLDDKFRKTNKLVKKWKRIEKFSKKSAGDIERERPAERPAPQPKTEVEVPKVETTPEEVKVKDTPVEKKAEKKVEKEKVEKAVTEPEAKEEKKEEKKVEKKKVEKAVTEPEAKEEKKEEKKVELKEKPTKEETVKKAAKKEKKEEKEVKKEKVEETAEKPVKPKKAPAKKTTKKTEEKVEEEAENAETK